MDQGELYSGGSSPFHPALWPSFELKDHKGPLSNAPNRHGLRYAENGRINPDYAARKFAEDARRKGTKMYFGTSSARSGIKTGERRKLFYETSV